MLAALPVAVALAVAAAWPLPPPCPLPAAISLQPDAVSLKPDANLLRSATCPAHPKPLRQGRDPCASAIAHARLMHRFSVTAGGRSGSGVATGCVGTRSSCSSRSCNGCKCRQSGACRDGISKYSTRARSAVNVGRSAVHFRVESGISDQRGCCIASSPEEWGPRKHRRSHETRRHRGRRRHRKGNPRRAQASQAGVETSIGTPRRAEGVHRNLEIIVDTLVDVGGQVRSFLNQQARLIKGRQAQLHVDQQVVCRFVKLPVLALRVHLLLCIPRAGMETTHACAHFLLCRRRGGTYACHYAQAASHDRTPGVALHLLVGALRLAPL